MTRVTVGSSATVAGLEPQPASTRKPEKAKAKRTRRDGRRSMGSTVSLQSFPLSAALCTIWISTSGV